MSDDSFLRACPEGVLLAIKVQTRAKSTEIVKIEHGVLKIRVQSPPVEGAANQEILDLLRKIFRVPRQNIQILRGEKNRCKWVEIRGLSLAGARAAVLSHHKS